MSRPRFHTKTWCLLAVCLLHSALLAAFMTSSEPVPQSSPPPVNLTLIPPQPPVVTAPVPEPETMAKPAPAPELARQPEPKPRPVEQAKPELFATVLPTEPTPALATETAPAEETTSTVSEPIFEADYLNNPAPIYPKLSRQRKEQGVVLLRVHVQADGQADQLEVLQSSGYERLDEAALRAVKRWQFVPAKLGDEVVDAWVRVPVRFNLNA